MRLGDSSVPSPDFAALGGCAEIFLLATLLVLGLLAGPVVVELCVFRPAVTAGALGCAFALGSNFFSSTAPPLSFSGAPLKGFMGAGIMLTTTFRGEVSTSVVTVSCSDSKVSLLLM